MDRNKFFSLVIIGVIAIGAIIYVLWLWLFNNGQVIFEGLPPFNVSIGGDMYMCNEQQCSFKLGARNYSYSISKEGYFDQSGYVDIERGKTVIVSYEAVFEARPLAGVDYPMLSLPVGYSKFEDKLLGISLFHLIQDGYQLSRMPKKVNNIVFAPSGQAAILFEDDVVNYYKTDIFTSKEMEVLKDAYTVVWSPDESAVYCIVYDDASKKDALVKVNLKDQSVEKLVYFLREIDEYWISISPDERYVALADLGGDTQILYLIDLEEASRTNVFEGHAIEGGVWSRDGNYFIFEGNDLDGGAPQLRILNSQNDSVENLGFSAQIDLITSTPDGKFYFVATQDYSVSGLTRPYFSNFEDADEDILTIDELISTDFLSLHMYDPKERQTYLILELVNSIPGIPQKIEANQDGGIIRMIVGDQYFDVKVGG